MFTVAASPGAKLPAANDVQVNPVKVGATVIAPDCSAGAVLAATNGER